MNSRRFIIPILLVLAVALVTLWFRARVEKLHGPGSLESSPGSNSDQQPVVEKSEARDIPATSGVPTNLPALGEPGNARLQAAMTNNPDAATNVPAPGSPITSIAGGTPPPPPTPPSPPPTTMHLTNAPVIPPGQGRPNSGP